jgi:hypothetical protein
MGNRVPDAREMLGKVRALRRQTTSYEFVLVLDELERRLLEDLRHGPAAVAAPAAEVASQVEVAPRVKASVPPVEAARKSVRASNANGPKKAGFDKRAYQRELMRKRRAAERAERAAGGKG